MAWSCPACGHSNDDAALVCDPCGVARRWHEDPALDVPPPPPWHHVGAVWAALAYGALALGGVLVLLNPAWLERLGIGAPWVVLEVLVCGGAFATALVEAVWQRRFNRAALSVPTTVRTGQPFEATLTLVPYETLERVSVRIELVDRYYEHVTRRGRRETRTRSRALERYDLQRGESVRARREHAFHVGFVAPAPSMAQHDVRTELAASMLSAVGVVVPGLGHYARNLREHGGFFVRAIVRFGIWRRVYEQRVIAVLVPIAAADAAQRTRGAASSAGRQP